MTKTILIALVCAASSISLAQAQTSGSVGGSASGSTGSGSTTGSTTGGITGGGSIATPPASAGAGVSGGARTNQPSVDINQAQQPGIGVNSGASGNGSIAPVR